MTLSSSLPLSTMVHCDTELIIAIINHVTPSHWVHHCHYQPWYTVTLSSTAGSCSIKCVFMRQCEWMIKQNTCNRQISPVFNLAKHVDYKSHQFNEINGFSLQKDSTTDRITPTPRLRVLFIISGYWCYNMYKLFCITKLENLNILKSWNWIETWKHMQKGHVIGF